MSPPTHTHINKCLRAGVIAQSVKCLLHPGGAGRSKEIVSSQFWGDRNRQSSVDFWPISLVHLMSSRSTRDTVSYSKVNGTRGMILNAGNWPPLAQALAHVQVCTHKSKQAHTQTHTLTRTKCSEAYLGYSHCHSVFIKICEGISREINKMEGDSKVALFFTVKQKKKGFLNGSMCYIKQLLCGNFSRWIIKTARTRTHTHTHKWLGRSGTQVSGIAFSRLLCGQKDYSYLLERVQFPNPSPQQNSHRREQATRFLSTPLDTLRNASQLFIIFGGIRCLQVVP